MGLESATFSFVPRSSQTIEGLSRIVQTLGGEVIPSGLPRREDFVYRSPRYWIDLRVLHQKQDDNVVLTIRLALCNPSGVRHAFVSLFGQLVIELPGTLTDLRSKCRWSDASSESLAEIQQCLMDQQQVFERDFGQFKAAISGDQVFEAMRQGVSPSTRDSPQPPPSG